MNVPPPVEATLFDLGGVLIEIDFDRVFRRWQPYSRLGEEELRRRFSMDAAYQQHERGLMSRSQYFAHLRHRLRLEASDEEIQAGWNAIFVDTIHDTLACARALKGRIPSFAFSNSNPTHQAAWMDGFPDVVAAFDGVFVSSDLGLRKPDPAAYEAVAQRAGIDPRTTLFFDDTRENIEGARSAGLQAIHVSQPGDVRSALGAAGLL